MASAVGLRADYSAAELRRLAASTRNANQSRRLLSLAAVLDGMNRTEAARIGGMDRQTLRDWVHRFNGHGPEGLLDSWSKGPEPRLSHRGRLRRLAQAHRPAPNHHIDRLARMGTRRSKVKALVVRRFVTRARAGSRSTGAWKATALWTGRLLRHAAYPREPDRFRPDPVGGFAVQSVVPGEACSARADVPSS